jgi:anthranilate phosphoribosyltransferase
VNRVSSAGDAAGLLRRLLAGENLSQAEAAAFIGEIMDGNFTPSQAAGLLVALAAKGESADEIVGAARAMRERSLHVEHDLPMVVDVVGTGGDHANTINISTMAALVVASAGIPVAKHGNRAASSACGSADVLEAAGMPIEIEPELAAEMLAECGFTFMFAPRYHPAMRNAAPVRRELGVRTIFNLLGPLTNPAGATHLVVGVAREDLVERVGEALRALGARRGAVVHGSGGVDEIVGDGSTSIYAFDEESAHLAHLEPAEFGIAEPLRTPVGGSVEAAHAAFLDVLGGAPSAASDVVAMNAAVVFYATGIETKLPAAFERARGLLRGGAVWPVFERAREFARRG